MRPDIIFNVLYVSVILSTVVLMIYIMNMDTSDYMTGLEENEEENDSNE